MGVDMWAAEDVYKRQVWYTPSLFFITMIVYHFHVFNATVQGNLSHLVGMFLIDVYKRQPMLAMALLLAMRLPFWMTYA